LAPKKRIKRRWHPVIGHGTKERRTIYATWAYFYQVARSRKLSVSELLERSVALYDLNNQPSIKEIEDFQEDIRGRIKLMEYRISTTRPTDLDRGLLDFYQEILDDVGDLVPE
jgi:hypothetical protein